MEEQFVALGGIAKGAVGEQFDAAFAEVVANICDPNTDPAVQRSVVIELRLKPNAQRNFAAYSLHIKAKLAPDLPTVGSFRIGRIGNRIEATEIFEEQATFLPANATTEAQ